MNYVKVATQADIPDGAAIRVDVGEKQIALVRCEGQIYAVDNVCTHEYAELHEGWVDGCMIECPLHGSEFDVKTGQPHSLPAVKPLQTFPVTTDGDDVLVGFEE